MSDERMPATVLALASLVPQLGPLPPHPCAWKEYPDAWVIVFDDGRKLRFEKASADERPVAPAEGHSSPPVSRKNSRRGT